MFRVRTAISGGPGGSELNTLFFNSSLTYTAQDAANAVHTFWNSMKTYIRNTYTLQVENTITEVADFTGHPIGTHTVSTAAVTGADAGAQLPPATQGLIRIHTGVYYGGRELQGKLYVPGMTVNVNNAGIPSAAFLTAGDNAIAAMISDLNSGLMVFSRKNLNANDATGGSTWNQFAVLRSRRL